MAKSSRIKSDGTLFTTGSIDEVTQLNISENKNYLRASEFDEITINPLTNGLVKRKTSDGKILVSKEFDEVSQSFVTDGLFIHFDAAENNSYPGSGNILYDLSGNGYNATLYNTPTFKTDFGGILSYDDAQFEYAQTSEIPDLSVWTVETWVRFNSAIGTKITSVVTNQYDLADDLNFSIGTNNAPLNYNITVGFFDGNLWRNVTGFAPSVGVWYHLVGTFDGAYIRFYVNGVENSNLEYSGNSRSGGSVRIARRWDSSVSDRNNFVNGDIPVVRIYSRALNQAEITQNFNATKSRHGL